MATDLLMWVGKEYYTVTEYIKEAKTMGVSKRIPSKMIPEITPGKSRLFLAHPEALVVCSNYRKLAEYLEGIGHPLSDDAKEELSDRKFVLTDKLSLTTPLPHCLIELKSVLEHMQETTPLLYSFTVKDFDIVYLPGIFAYTYLTGVQYVTRDGEESLPEKYAHLEGLVEPVKVERKQ